mmetsp:Transcript_3883/g.6108  ORF Transcript_3883/g.6108 Transcript_3883/m.6108 type:complete len:94 (-) Transcript_3883:34-315(-)
MPEAIKDLGSLTNLFVQGNKITSLPASILEIGTIKRVTLTGNPIPTAEAEQTKILEGLKKTCEDNGGKYLGPEKPVAAAGGRKFNFGKLKGAS